MADDYKVDAEIKEGAGSKAVSLADGTEFNDYILYVPSQARFMAHGINNVTALASLHGIIMAYFHKFTSEKSIESLAIMTKLLGEMTERSADVAMNALPDDLRAEVEEAALRLFGKESRDEKVN